MDNIGRADHIQDVLVRLHSGQWFGWSDSKNKIYENLIIYESEYDKPAEKELTEALIKMQSDFDDQEYIRKRIREYPSIESQLDYIFHNGIDKWKTDMIIPVKEKYPKK